MITGKREQSRENDHMGRGSGHGRVITGKRERSRENDHREEGAVTGE
jgi:hypothetical protein